MEIYTTVCMSSLAWPHARLVFGFVFLIYIEDDVPSMRDLNRYVVHKCASEWEDIAFELGLDKQVEIIKKDNRECKDCLRRTLQKWLDSSTPPATWKTLEVAITNAKRAQLFLDPVCDVYGENASCSVHGLLPVISL